jgi:hypothetical protein
MADDAFAADAAPYGDIVVIGGGCYGSYYVRQLARARRAGKLRYRRVVVVDRDPACAVTRDAERHIECELVVRDWTHFLHDFLPASGAADAIVPSPLMPHLLYEWLLARARARWPGRDVATVPLTTPVPTPWFRAGDETAYASYATWMCPVNCVEPRICPHTRDVRDWTMPDAVRAAVAASAPGEGALVGPVIFHCTHRAFGVGMIDARDVVAADARVTELAAARAASVLVGTVSHCPGALSVLHVGPPA